jgi:small basic protein
MMETLDLHAPLLLAGALIPFVTALLTRWKAPDAVKAGVSIAAAAAVAVARTAIDDGLDLTWHVFSTGFVEVWCTALVTWLGATGDFTARLNQATGNFGLGTAPAVEPIKPTPPPVNVG